MSDRTYQFPFGHRIIYFTPYIVGVLFFPPFQRQSGWIHGSPLAANTYRLPSMDTEDVVRSTPIHIEGERSIYLLRIGIHMFLDGPEHDECRFAAILWLLTLIDSLLMTPRTSLVRFPFTWKEAGAYRCSGLAFTPNARAGVVLKQIGGQFHLVQIFEKKISEVKDKHNQLTHNTLRSQNIGFSRAFKRRKC